MLETKQIRSQDMLVSGQYHSFPHSLGISHPNTRGLLVSFPTAYNWQADSLFYQSPHRPRIPGSQTRKPERQQSPNKTHSQQSQTQKSVPTNLIPNSRCLEASVSKPRKPKSIHKVTTRTYLYYCTQALNISNKTET